MNPMYIAAGGAAAIGAGYLLYKNNKKTAGTVEEAVEAAKLSSGAAVAAKQSEAVSVVQMDGETEEYNLAREKYRMLTGELPPRSWTLDMINSWIEEQQKKSAILAEYIELVSANSDYTKQADTAEMTYNDLVQLIAATKNEVANNKEKARLDAVKRQAEALAKAFRNTLLKPNYDNLCLQDQNAWDVATLNAMLQLTDEGKEWCEYFFEKDGPVKLPGYFNQAKKAYKEYTSIYDSILTSNTGRQRRGASTAYLVKDAFAGVRAAAGADGSRGKGKKKATAIVSIEMMQATRKANAIGDKIIKFHLQ